MVSLSAYRGDQMKMKEDGNRFSVDWQLCPRHPTRFLALANGELCCSEPQCLTHKPVTAGRRLSRIETYHNSGKTELMQSDKNDRKKMERKRKNKSWRDIERQRRGRNRTS
ncbi:hypothetical protein RRG08_048778 [Elysia crispata]|uniref:Uncharacterized protein n=1 Tax=Elysia crispata TaxID=231223 RepID=A0AAE1E1M3_9GAST|nr:hypothetical protein RRG08_048778 [Elysia crispata]